MFTSKPVTSFKSWDRFFSLSLLTNMDSRSPVLKQVLQTDTSGTFISTLSGFESLCLRAIRLFIVILFSSSTASILAVFSPEAIYTSLFTDKKLTSVYYWVNLIDKSHLHRNIILKFQRKLDKQLLTTNWQPFWKVDSNLFSSFQAKVFIAKQCKDSARRSFPTNLCRSIVVFDRSRVQKENRNVLNVKKKPAVFWELLFCVVLALNPLFQYFFT